MFGGFYVCVEAIRFGSAGELNFLWTNGSWHYHNYYIKVYDEEHEEQDDEAPFETFSFIEDQEDNRDYRYEEDD